MTMHNPPHPGGVLKEIIIPDTGITVTELASKIGCSRKTLSSFINGHSRIIATMAVKLEKELNAPSAEMWMKMQIAYDLWQAREEIAA